MLFEDKHGFDLITLIPVFEASCGLAGSIKIEVQIAGGFLHVLTRFGFFLWLLVKDKIFEDGCYLKIHWLMFKSSCFHVGEANQYLKFIQL